MLLLCIRRVSPTFPRFFLLFSVYIFSLTAVLHLSLSGQMEAQGIPMTLILKIYLNFTVQIFHLHYLEYFLKEQLKGSQRSSEIH